MVLRQVRQTWVGQLKWRGHWRPNCRTVGLSTLNGVIRQVVERRCGWVLTFSGERYDLRAQLHIENECNNYKVPLIALCKLYIIQMQTQQLQRYDLVESFLQSVRNAQSKQEFLSRVQEFDSRFTEENSGPTYSQKQKSMQKLPPIPQQKPKNPFKTNVDDFRHHSMMQTAQNQPQNYPFAPQMPPRGNYSRSEQNFYKMPSNQGLKTQQYPMQTQYGAMGNQNPASNYGGMGVLNYNAYSQRQYDELKQQFFRPPNVARPNEQYNRLSEDNVFNFGQMNMGLGMNSQSEILGSQNSFSKPTGRGYAQRVNPFMKQ